MCSPAGTRTYFPGSMVTVYLLGYGLPSWLRFTFMVTVYLHDYGLPSWLRFTLLVQIEGGEVRVLIASFDKHLQSRSRTLVG